MTSPFGNPSFGCRCCCCCCCWDCGCSPNAKVVEKQKHRRNARRRKCIVFFVVVVVVVVVLLFLIINIIIWCCWCCLLLPKESRDCDLTTMLSCGKERRVFFWSLSSLQNSFLFPATNKTRQNNNNNKENNETSRSIQIWMSFAFFSLKRGKSGPNVEDIFFFFSFFGLEYLFFPSLAPFSTVSS